MSKLQGLARLQHFGIDAEGASEIRRIREVGRAAATYLADAPYAALVAFPATDEEGETAAAPPATRVVLDNGLTVLAEERPGSMVFAVNTSPFAGREGVTVARYVTVPVTWAKCFASSSKKSPGAQS